MNHPPLQKISRILLMTSGILLWAVLFFPLWRIDLIAPQYPEGLKLLIYPHELAGNVDIINGLNHYIGMKTLHTADFIEFRLLPYLIGFFALAYMIAAWLNNKKIFLLLFALFICFGILAMYDFWRWEYNYGHELNPDAAIRVPGMSYQPPLIGFKQLLNFGAYSFPDIGAWLFIIVGLISFGLLFLEWKQKNTISTRNLVMLFLLLSISACNNGPDKIMIGTDHCSSCKMRISDVRFGAELVTTKGKVYKFDDAACLKRYISTEKNRDNHQLYISLYNSNHELTEISKAILVQSKSLRGPMNGNLIAFTDSASINIDLKNDGRIISWKEFMQQ